MLTVNGMPFERFVRYGPRGGAASAKTRAVRGQAPFKSALCGRIWDMDRKEAAWVRGLQPSKWGVAVIEGALA